MEISYLSNLFLKNGYPNCFFDQSLKKSDDENKSDTQTPKAYFSRSIKVPYYGKSSNQFANRLVCLVKRKFNVNVSVYYTSFKTSSYFQLKCSTPAALMSNVVYKFNCLHDANCSYIGMTTGLNVTRAHEHLHSTITKTAIAEHLKVCDDCKKNSTINSLNIIRKCNTKYEIKIHEALQINP